MQGYQRRIRGVCDGDLLPAFELTDAQGANLTVPASVLDLSPSGIGLSPRTGESWSERVLSLLSQHGPFTLAWLEALLRAADQRASQQPLADPRLNTNNADHELATSNSSVAQTPPGGTPAAPLESDSPARGPLHGHGRETGERSTDSSTTRRPYAATRYLETHHGILSYAELAPLLAEHVANTEQDIAERRLTTHRFDDTLLELHRRICADLIPAMAGHWRTLNVCVNAHTPPPPYWTIPAYM